MAMKMKLTISFTEIWLGGSSAWSSSPFAIIVHQALEKIRFHNYDLKLITKWSRPTNKNTNPFCIHTLHLYWRKNLWRLKFVPRRIVAEWSGNKTSTSAYSWRLQEPYTDLGSSGYLGLISVPFCTIQWMKMTYLLWLLMPCRHTTPEEAMVGRFWNSHNQQGAGKEWHHLSTPIHYLQNKGIAWFGEKLYVLSGDFFCIMP